MSLPSGGRGGVWSGHETIVLHIYAHAHKAKGSVFLQLYRVTQIHSQNRFQIVNRTGVIGKRPPMPRIRMYQLISTCRVDGIILLKDYADGNYQKCGCSVVTGFPVHAVVYNIEKLGVRLGTRHRQSFLAGLTVTLLLPPWAGHGCGKQSYVWPGNLHGQCRSEGWG